MKIKNGLKEEIQAAEHKYKILNFRLKQIVASKANKHVSLGLNAKPLVCDALEATMS